MGKASREKKQRFAKLIKEHGAAEAMQIRNKSRLARKKNNLLKGGVHPVRVDKDSRGKEIPLRITDRFSPTAKKFLSL